MTRKRYNNLLRAILIEYNKQGIKVNTKNLEKGFEKLPRYYAKEFGSYSYAELFKAFELSARRYGIGGY